MTRRVAYISKELARDKMSAQFTLLLSTLLDTGYCRPCRDLLRKWVVDCPSAKIETILIYHCQQYHLRDSQFHLDCLFRCFKLPVIRRSAALYSPCWAPVLHLVDLTTTGR